MDLAFRYPVIVQVISRDSRDLFYGYVPNFGIETYEIVDPGNVAQEYMFHLKLRRMIQEALSVFKAQEKEPPLIPDPKSLTSPASIVSPENGTPQLLSTTTAASMLGVHPDTIRSLFDTGVLKGSLTQGGQRMILLSSVLEEELRMQQRAELRKFELRSKKKNSRRRKCYIEKQRKEKLESINKI
jgi:hypothetical protein